MKNAAHFRVAKELNDLFETDPTTALNKAIDYVNANQLDTQRLANRSNILPSRLDLLLQKKRRFDEKERKRFLEMVIELLAEHGTPIEPEW